ncbi:MAG: hypothetical protein QME90_03670 [Thermodesulfobacteriota bacterium]|nr:hypothetical protein [Thermodesulfobacteriota bacterium]
MMISKILIIASATREASVSILDAFQLIQSAHSERPAGRAVKVIFVSYLSDLFKGRLGFNTLTHWVKEEKECLERVKSYFTRMDIPYDFKVITIPPWEAVFNEINEINDGVHHLVILQGEFLKMLRKNEAYCGLCTDVISKLKCPIWVINSDEETSCPPLNL